jgi:hypothetical protein
VGLDPLPTEMIRRLFVSRCLAQYATLRNGWLEGVLPVR